MLFSVIWNFIIMFGFLLYEYKYEGIFVYKILFFMFFFWMGVCLFYVENGYD